MFLTCHLDRSCRVTRLDDNITAEPQILAGDAAQQGFVLDDQDDR